MWNRFKAIGNPVFLNRMKQRTHTIKQFDYRSGGKILVASILLGYLFLFAHCSFDPLAQDLPSLQKTQWVFSESYTSEEVNFSQTIRMRFRDEETVILEHDFTETSQRMGVQSGSYESRYTYRYDRTQRTGLFIGEDGNTLKFELRANLLLLTINNDTYIFRKTV